jgi:hypothetical protein
MERFLAATLYVFFGLSVVHWCHLGSSIRDPTPMMCGNVITDPLLFLINWAGPYSALCAAALFGGRVRLRRRPFLPFMVPPLLLGTAAALGLEVAWLREYGIDLSGTVWWLPGL